MIRVARRDSLERRLKEGGSSERKEWRDRSVSARVKRTQMLSSAW